jgi:hypothetical protein
MELLVCRPRPFDYLVYCDTLSIHTTGSNGPVYNGRILEQVNRSMYILINAGHGCVSSQLVSYFSPAKLSETELTQWRSSAGSFG